MIEFTRIFHFYIAQNVHETVKAIFKSQIQLIDIEN